MHADPLWDLGKFFNSNVNYVAIYLYLSKQSSLMDNLSAVLLIFH